MRYSFIAIDFQKDFTEKAGKCFKPRSSIDFVKQICIPFLREKSIKIHEIISDYRQPRPGDRGLCCIPGKSGYESEIPDYIKDSNIWIKCMNSPVWVRNNAGIAELEPGIPYQDTQLFDKWLEENIGSPNEVIPVLIGLTIDCCVLCTAQELNFRGYNVLILNEGVDTFSGDLKEKEFMLNNPPLTNWCNQIEWKNLVKLL